MTTTHRIIKTLLLVGAAACLVWLFVVYGEARASTSGACSVKQARHNAVETARRAREAAKVYRATQTYSSRYGPSVGRWVQLSRRVGWPWPQTPKLMYVINRESRGNPLAKNPTSTASGLLQFLSSWWAGKWNPFNARQNLYHGCKAWHDVGWTPWAL